MITIPGRLRALWGMPLQAAGRLRAMWGTCLDLLPAPTRQSPKWTHLADSCPIRLPIATPEFAFGPLRRAILPPSVCHCAPEFVFGPLQRAILPHPSAHWAPEFAFGPLRRARVEPYLMAAGFVIPYRSYWGDGRC
ncbi:MAG: hypothetical protein IPK82_11170 [Polyangiaceae bacterium]|nr:hypothetical protein [Polyangiaceae bacterium]